MHHLGTTLDLTVTLVVPLSAMTRAQAGPAGTIASLIASGAELASGFGDLAAARGSPASDDRIATKGAL